ncbi:MAG: hypothetical protein ABEJ76_00395 [Halanaeroarchaeum sp.]
MDGGGIVPAPLQPGSRQDEIECLSIVERIEDGVQFVDAGVLACEVVQDPGAGEVSRQGVNRHAVSLEDLDVATVLAPSLARCDRPLEEVGRGVEGARPDLQAGLVDAHRLEGVVLRPGRVLSHALLDGGR